LRSDPVHAYGQVVGRMNGIGALIKGGLSLVVVSFKIPEEHLEALREKAAANDRSISAEIRRAIRIYLQAGQEEVAAGT
jgi:hypothetical protein